MRDYIAIVAKIYAVPFKKKSKHYWGMRPRTSDELDTRVEMKRPEFLLIESGPEGGAHLNRYTSTGEFAGDTWDHTIELVKEHAETEFDGYFSEWHEIPLEVDDPLKYALEHLELFDTVFRIKLHVKNLPFETGPKVIDDILQGFALRPWDKNVTCKWNEIDRALIFQADNEFDKRGLVLREELFEAISACIENVKIENIVVESVTEIALL